MVDPLDGTINFAHGFPFWCVSIALEHEGRLVVGVVHDPLSGATYAASEGDGATLDGRPLGVSAAEGLSRCLIATALPVNFAEDADRQMAYMRRFSTGTHSVRRTGSSALNLALVAAGACDVCYATSMNPWDAAAGVVLVREAGGTVTDLSGAPYDLYRGEILATNGRVHAESLRFLAEARGGPRRGGIGDRPRGPRRTMAGAGRSGSWRVVLRHVIVAGAVERRARNLTREPAPLATRLECRGPRPGTLRFLLGKVPRLAPIPGGC